MRTERRAPSATVGWAIDGWINGRMDGSGARFFVVVAEVGQNRLRVSPFAPGWRGARPMRASRRRICPPDRQ
eukprot:3439914-Pyramimonas_sp.AAC.1